MILGNVLNFFLEVVMMVGVWFVCIIGFFMFLVYIGVFFMLSYLLLKVIIQGMLKVLWFVLMMILNVNGMLVIVMWLQCVLVSLFILLVFFGGDIVLVFYNKFMLMVNVLMILLYLFFVLVFFFFKVCQDLEWLFVFFKIKVFILVVMGVVVLVVMFVNVFIIIQLVIEVGDWDSVLWMIGGLIFFLLLVMVIYQNYSSCMSVDLEWVVE